MEVNLAVQQEKTILKIDQGFFLVKRTIHYETGFETDLELVGNRYEIWADEYKEKYQQDIIEEYTGGKMVHYCKLYTAETDEDMLQIFAAHVKEYQ
jgi:hypothetical protein